MKNVNTKQLNDTKETGIEKRIVSVVINSMSVVHRAGSFRVLRTTIRKSKKKTPFCS